ncbi:flagellar assembly protein FliX [Crenalkalicoccus roseus]|uniref:flagellar assembly protein FliX n=1 Tax=Crenalkalicoccus roseus TaxID=1485588 RepID=UPI0010820322|nr:flagellar assembly protein FliX [Crenalkalicoccus roseus]
MRGIGSVGAPTGPAARRGGRLGARGFGVAAEGAPAAQAAYGATGVAALSGAGLLALQAMEDPAARDAAARRRAEAMLDELRDLQLGLLDGAAEMGRLRRLAALRVGEDGADPALREVVQGIALRAAVELARRGFDSPATER